MTHAMPVAAPAAMDLRVAPPIDTLSTPRLVALHLIPGALATAVFVLFAPVVESAGFPPLAAFLIAIAGVIVPFELGVVVLAGRSGSGGLLAAVPYRRPLSGRGWLIYLPLTLVASVVGFGLLAAFEPAIRDALFGWLPAWFLAPVALESITAYAPSAWAVTLVAYAALNAVIGPVTEELYFRGYLLPRMSRYGRLAPLLNTVLFSIYHFWSPWQLLSRIAGVAPFAYAAWRTQNVFLACIVHALLNTISVAAVIAMVMSQLG